MSGILLDVEGSMSLRMSCSTVTESITVTLKLSFSPLFSEMNREATSRHMKNQMGNRRLTTYNTGLLLIVI